MRIRLRPLAAGKRGNARQEYEDALWPRRGLVGDGIRCAVADGATEASFSGLWARLLVEAYRRGALGPDLAALPILQRRWQERVQRVPLPWYAEEKARLGAFSALLGLTITDGGWEALAVGDSCLFHRREGSWTVFPIGCSALLTAAPHLIPSLPARSTDITAHLHRAHGSLQSSDTLYLATDALAGWLLRHIEAGSPCADLDTLQPATFPAWLEAQRDARTIRNDDTTVIRIDVL